MNQTTWYKVPLYCIVSSIIVWYLTVWILGRFTLVTLPDGTITVDSTRSLILYGFTFLVVVCVGGLAFFRKLTKMEIFFSASIWVVCQLGILLVEWIIGGSQGVSGIIFLWLAKIFEWSNLINQVLFSITDNLWFASIVQAFAPYIFLLFGKRRDRSVEEIEE